MGSLILTLHRWIDSYTFVSSQVLTLSCNKLKNEHSVLINKFYKTKLDEIRRYEPKKVQLFGKNFLINGYEYRK